MKTILIQILIVTIFSCNSSINNNPKLINEYKLIEILADPGDGSGIYQSVKSTKTIKFYSNNTFISNGDICSLSITSNSISKGTYSIKELKIFTTNCDSLNFEINGEELILKYPCFEPCLAKYTSN